MKVNSAASTRPLISVVITSYNRANWIGQAMESVLGQDYPNLELVISDNDSTDGSHEVISAFLHDDRVKYYRNETNIGMIPNFCKAILELAKGEYVTHLSSDDYFCSPSFLSEMAEVFINYPAVQIYQANTLLLYEATGKISTTTPFEFYKDTFYRQQHVQGLTCFFSFAKMGMISFGATGFRRESLSALNIDRSISVSFDFLVVLQLLLIGDVYFSDKAAYIFRQHPGQQSASFNTADAFINNLRFIEVAYAAALAKGSADRAVLEKWRNDMTFPHLRYAAHRLLKVDAAEFAKVDAYTRQNFPALRRRIHAEPKFIAKKIFFSLKRWL